MRLILTTFSALVFLGGCAGTIPGVSRQGDAGITDVKVEWCKSADQGHYLCSIRWRDGKEKQNVALAVELPSGAVVKYSATGVKAFKAHEIRAAVEKAISKDISETFPEVVDTVVKAIMGMGL